MMEILENSEHLSQLGTPHQRKRQIVTKHLDNPDMILPSLVEDYQSRTKPSATTWIEKSCLHSFHIKDINRAFPDAKFIHLVRDPRATINSIAKRTFVDVSNDWCVATHGYRRFNGTIEEELRDISSERQRRVHYEDLVCAPADTLEQCCDFLRVAFDKAMLTHERFVREFAAPGSATAQYRVTTDFLEEWKRSLSPEKVLCIERFTRDLLCTSPYASAGTHVSQAAYFVQLTLLNIKHLVLHIVEKTVELGRNRPFVFSSLAPHLSTLLRSFGGRRWL